MKDLAIIEKALFMVEWRGHGYDGHTPSCHWCSGWKSDPQMDEDYYGRAGHKPDCPRQAALAAIERLKMK